MLRANAQFAAARAHWRGVSQLGQTNRWRSDRGIPFLLIPLLHVVLRVLLIPNVLLSKTFLVARLPVGVSEASAG